MSDATVDNASFLVDGKYGIADLVDLDRLRDVFEKFTKATGFTIGFLDHPGLNILAATGWRKICTEFHRGCPAAAAICVQSNRRLLDALSAPGEVLIEGCDNGLTDCATPIIIKGKHIASLATGQLLLAPPELGRFRRQAHAFGVDEASYLEALREIPVVDPETLRNVTIFLGEMALLISEMGYANLVGKENAGLLANEVAERRRTEEDLRRASTLLDSIVENIPDMVFLKDAKHLRFVRFNRAGEELLGYSREDLLGKSDHDFFPAAQADFFNEKDRQVLHGRKIVDIPEEPLETRFRGTRLLHTKKAPVLDANGEPEYLLGISEDITDRRKAEESRRESEEKYRMLFDSAGDAIFIHDDRGRILAANRPACERLGYDRAEALSLTVDDVDSPAEAPQAAQRIAQLLEHGQLFFETTHRRKNGDLIPTEVNARRITWEGRPAIMSVCRDITERKQLEAERAKLEVQLQQAMKMEAVGRLAGGVAHDFNNLLTAITGYSEMLLSGLRGSDPMRADVNEIKKAAERAAALTAQLLAFSRKQVIDPKVIDLNELLVESAKMIGRIIGEDVEFQFLPGPDLAAVKVDPHQLDQVLVNLSVNARDAMRDGGKLTVETSNIRIDEAYTRGRLDARPGDYVLLAISDNGCGMSPEVKEHLFEPFFTTKEKGKGTGLGLSMIYGIVRQNGGFINVYSEPGVGTTFKIYLPTAAGEVESVRKSAAAALPTGGESILLVEDEEMVRNLARKILERQGYRVLAVEHGGKAYVLAKDPATTIDLLLTDVVMPDMNGRQLYETICPLRPGLRVLYMSGYTENAIAHHGILDHGTHFIQKPFTIDGLARKVRDVLDGD